MTPEATSAAPVDRIIWKTLANGELLQTWTTRDASAARKINRVQAPGTRTRFAISSPSISKCRRFQV